MFLVCFILVLSFLFYFYLQFCKTFSSIFRNSTLLDKKPVKEEMTISGYLTTVNTDPEYEKTIHINKAFHDDNGGSTGVEVNAYAVPNFDPDYLEII